MGDNDEFSSRHVGFVASVRHPHKGILDTTGCIIIKLRRESLGL